MNPIRIPPAAASWEYADASMQENEGGMSMQHPFASGARPPRFRMTRLAGMLIGMSAILSSPAMAGCLGQPDENYCYSALATVSHTVDPVGYVEDRHSGATPQTALIPRSGSAFASASSDSAHNGTLSVQTAVDDYSFLAYAEASLQYTFRVSSIPGSSPSDALVALNVESNAVSLREQTFASETATFELDQDGVAIARAGGIFMPEGREITIFSFNELLNVKPDDDIVVKMFASSSSYAYPISGVDRLASGVLLDPVFEIAPEDASRYTLTGLPLGSDTAPVAPVPEPGTWAMMAAGFGLLGSMMRRRRAGNSTLSTHCKSSAPSFP
jgi:PEP-CTERM motif